MTKRTLSRSPRPVLRNLSKNSLKRLMRPFNGGAAGYAYRWANYFFFNEGGAKAWVQSKGAINNLTGHGYAKYLTKPQALAWANYWK